MKSAWETPDKNEDTHHKRHWRPKESLTQTKIRHFDNIRSINAAKAEVRFEKIVARRLVADVAVKAGARAEEREKKKWIECRRLMEEITQRVPRFTNR
jgi:hypothetical protein